MKPFLRRMPLQVRIELPDARQRESILRVLLADVETPRPLNLRLIAEKAVGLSGSDLREVCRRALINAPFSDDVYQVGEYDIIDCIGRHSDPVYIATNFGIAYGLQQTVFIRSTRYVR